MIIDTSSVLNYINEIRDASCSPIRQPQKTIRTRSRATVGQDTNGMFSSSEQPSGAMEERRDDESSQALDAIVDGVVEEIIRDTTAATSAALKSVRGSATAIIFPPSSPTESDNTFSSTPEEAAASSSPPPPPPAATTRTAPPPPAALSEVSRVTTTPNTTSTTTTRTMDEEKSEGQKLLSRSQARRKNLQQSYNQIMSSNLPITIQEQHDQYRQQSNHREERSDSETYATIKSPRVRKLYDFEIHDRVEEYTPTHHQSSITTNANEWDSARIRREHRMSVQKSAFDIDEIDQLTKEMRLIVKQRNPKVNDDDEGKQTKLQQLVKEFEEEWSRKPTQTRGNLKRLSHFDVKKEIINEDDTKAVATRWKALQTKPQDHDNNSDILISSKKAQNKKEIPDDELEAWWKERQQIAKRTFSASERFDKWWENQKESKSKKEHVGGGSATAFQELEGEPTVEDDVATRKRLSSIVPSNEDGDVAASSGRDCGEGISKEQRDDTQSSAAAYVPHINEDMSNQPQSHANNVASGTLKIVLSRVDEAKEQFVKALEENDVQKQSELAALLARLGEAAAAMKKLGQL